MRRFQEFFPELKNIKNHTIVILEEVFNKYYELLPTQEEKTKLIQDFSKLIRQSSIENAVDVAIPISIEDDKMYFIEDYFLQNYNQEVKSLIDEIDRGRVSFDEMESAELFNNDNETEMIDDTPIEKEDSFSTHKQSGGESSSSSGFTQEEKPEDDVDISDAFSDSSQSNPTSTINDGASFSLFSEEMQHISDLSEQKDETKESLDEVSQNTTKETEKEYKNDTIDKKDRQEREVREQEVKKQEELKKEKTKKKTKEEPELYEIEDGYNVRVFDKALDDIFYNEEVLELTESLKQINGVSK